MSPLSDSAPSMPPKYDRELRPHTDTTPPCCSRFSSNSELENRSPPGRNEPNPPPCTLPDGPWPVMAAAPAPWPDGRAPIGDAPIEAALIDAAPTGFAPIAVAPIGCPNCDRKPSAKSRSMPGRNSRPANRARKPRSRGAAIRCSTCSTTCSAVARPNRASSAAGIRSAFSIVPVASASSSHAPAAFDSTSTNVSSPSSCASSSTVTSMVLLDSPAWNVSVPLAAL